MKNVLKRLLLLVMLTAVGSSSFTASYAETKQVFTAYDAYPRLDFEDVLPDHSTWGGNIELSFVKNNANYPAYSGVGAMYVNSTGGQFSVWGGPTTGEGNQPKAGDKVCGYFYYKRLSDAGDWKLPRVRIYSEAEGNVESSWYAVTKDIESTGKNSLPLNEWVKIELESTGKIVSESDIGHMGYNITCDGTGAEFMIDNVVFGTVTEEEIEVPSTPGVTVISAVPVINEYAGSTINGDFEVGNDSVGNQYWGSWPDGGLRLITNPVNTEAGSTVSGKNMIEIAAENNSWNLFNFAASADEALPKLNDIAGGSYWLYVPKNADLTKNIPFVTFGYQGSSGDVIISTGEGYDKGKLVKGAWNQIPIYPVSNGKITEVDMNKYAGIFIVARGHDTNVKYYIDNIRVGSIKNGVFFSDSTLYKKDGTPVGDGEVPDKLDATITVQNSQINTDVNAECIVAAYESGRLMSVKKADALIKGKGASGISVNGIKIADIDVSGVDRDKLKIKAFLFDSLKGLQPLTGVCNMYYKTKRIAPDNENIKYIGRWSGNSKSYKSTYIRPYLKTNFTGTSLKIDLAETSSLVVTIDGKTTTYNSANGQVVLADNLNNGEHSLRIATLHYSESLNYNGLYIDSDAELKEPELESTHIEFIGDSITAWDNGYSWQVGEALGVEHSRIAWPGIALVDGYGYTGLNPLWGIATGYFKTGLAGVQGTEANVADWNFDTADYKPDIFVINIGTNDCESIWAVPYFLENYTNTYSTFIDKLRNKFPEAEIFVMRAVSMPRANVNEAVYNMITPKLKADSKLHYVDTTNWGVTILNDGIHPDTNGHSTIKEKLVNILTQYIK